MFSKKNNFFLLKKTLFFRTKHFSFLTKHFFFHFTNFIFPTNNFSLHYVNINLLFFSFREYVMLIHVHIYFGLLVKLSRLHSLIIVRSNKQVVSYGKYVYACLSALGINYQC